MIELGVDEDDPGDKDAILDDPSGPNVIIRVSKRWKTEVGESEREKTGRCYDDGFEDGGRSHEPQNTGSL